MASTQGSFVKRRSTLPLIALAASLAVAAGSLVQASPAAAASATPSSAVAEAARGVGGLGIELLGLQLTAENYLIGLRYRVTDLSKSRMLVERNVQPVLVNEATGERYYVPHTPAHRSPPRASAKPHRPPMQAQLGKTYLILFANPDRKLRPGEKVTLYAGDSVLQHIEVR